MNILTHLCSLIAFKPNSTNIVVSNMWCNGSHGISVGSLGQVCLTAKSGISVVTAHDAQY